MRKIDDSSNASSRIWLSFCAEAQVATERLFDDHPSAGRAVGLFQLLDDQPEQHGRNGEVIRGVLRRCQAPCAWPEMWQRRCSRRPHSAADRSVFRTRRGRRRRVLQGCRGRVPSNWSRSQPALATPMTGTFRLPRFTIACSDGKDLFVSQVARGSEKHECVGLNVGRSSAPPHDLADFSRWPPNSNRIADKTLSWKSAFAARTESFVQRGRKHRRRHAFVDRGFDRPPPLTRIGNAPGKLGERGIFDERQSPSGPTATRRSRCRGARLRRYRAG